MYAAGAVARCRLCGREGAEEEDEDEEDDEDEDGDGDRDEEADEDEEGREVVVDGRSASGGGLGGAICRWKGVDWCCWRWAGSGGGLSAELWTTADDTAGVGGVEEGVNSNKEVDVDVEEEGVLEEGAVRFLLLPFDRGGAGMPAMASLTC